jgi:hypothetical protein
MTFQCLYIFPELFQLLYFSSFYPSPLLMVVSTALQILYSFLYRVHQLYSPS